MEEESVDNLLGRLAALTAVEHTINVKYNEQAAAVGVLIRSAANAQTQAFIVLRYTRSPQETDLSLHLTFASSQPTAAPPLDARCPVSPAAVCAGPYEPCYYDATCQLGGLGCSAGGLTECRFCGFAHYDACPVQRCEVWRGRRYCGSAGWQQASLPCTETAAPSCAGQSETCYFDPECGNPATDPFGGLGCYAGGHATCRFCGFGSYPDCPTSSAATVREYAQVVTISALTASAYRVFVGAPPRLCRGYGLQGGVYGRVDCIGNCWTGTGYCYATAESTCAPCRYYVPPGGLGYGEQLCSDFGEAQGGPLYGTSKWTEASCPLLDTPPSEVHQRSTLIGRPWRPPWLQ